VPENESIEKILCQYYLKEGIGLNLTEWVFGQSRNPSGFWGRTMGRLMNLAHVPLYRRLCEEVPSGAGDQVLDIGCGGGKCISLFAQSTPGVTVFGIDTSSEMIAMAEKINRKFIEQGRVKLYEGSVSVLPFEDSCFDLVVACESIHFWPDLEKDLDEVARVLKPGGHFLVLNRYARNKKEAEKMKEHFSLLYPEDYRNVLERAGFTVKKKELIEGKGQLVVVGVICK